MYCRKCGFEIPDDSAFCVKCGAPVESAAGAMQKQDQTILPNEEKSAVSAAPGKKKTGLIIACVAVVLALVLAFFLFFFPKGAKDDGADGSDAADLPAMEEAPVSILEDKEKLAEITASCLKIECHDVTGEVYATGSGFAAFGSDLIVTNYHVIEDHPHAINALSENGKSYVIDTIVTYNEEMDIAILKTQADASFKPLTFSETNVEKTDKVVAIGSPLGLMNLVSEGIVSGFTQIGNETVIQFTASISHGSSGGVLLNEAGEVVGVTFASYSAGQNLNMAIPIQYVRALYEQASPSEAVTVIQFFDAVDHIYPLTYVLEHGDEFMGKTVIFQVYVSSLTYYHSEPDSKAMFYLVENKSDSLGMTLQGRSYEFSSAFFIEHEKVKAWKAIEVWTTRSVASAKIHPGSMITISGTLTTLDDVFGDNDMSLTLKDFTIFD